MQVNSETDLVTAFSLDRYSVDGDSLSSVELSTIQINPMQMETETLAWMEPLIILDRRERIWQTFRRNDEYRLTVFWPNGSVERVVEKEFDRVLKTAEELEEERQFYQRVMDRLQRESGGMPADFEFPVIDPLKTTVQSISYDPGGYIWVKVNTSKSGATNTFDLFDLAGRYVTRFVIGAHERIDRIAIGAGHLCVVTGFDEEFQQINVYTIDIPGRD
jgi:hypothetical protein